MSVRGMVLAVVLLAGCNGGKDGGPLVSSDVRIDEAPDDLDVDSAGTRMCVNVEGHIFVVWTDDRDGQLDVWINRSLDAGRSWMPAPVKVNHGDADVFAPDVACTADAVYVAWEDQRDGEILNRNIYFNRSSGNPEDLGVAWDAEDTLIDPDEEGYTMSLGPTVEAVGNDVYVSWFDNLNGSYDVFVAASDNGGRSFQTVRRADSDDAGEAYSAWPRTHATGDGDVYVTWEDARNGGQDIFFAVSHNNGTTFRNDARLDKGDSRGQHDSFAPELGAYEDNVYVVWHDTRGGEARDIYMNYSADFGDSWLDAAERVETDNLGFFDSLFPVVTVNNATAHIAWSDKSAADGGYDVYYRRAVQGGLQDEMYRLNRDPEGYFNHTGVQVVQNDEALVVAWQDYRDDNTNSLYNDIYYNFSQDNGTTWAEADFRIDSMEPGQAFKVDLNLALHRGEILSAWTDGRNGTSDVFFHHLRVGEASNYIASAGEAPAAE